MNKTPYIFIVFAVDNRVLRARQQPATSHAAHFCSQNRQLLSTAVAVAGAVAATQNELFRHDFRSAKFLRELMAIVIVMVMGLLVSTECDVAANRPRDNIAKWPHQPSAFSVYVLLISLARNAWTKLPSQRHSAELGRFDCIIYGVAWVEFCSRFYIWCGCQTLTVFESHSNEQFRFWMCLTLFAVGCTIIHVLFYEFCVSIGLEMSLISHARSHKQKVVLLHVE